MARAFLLIHLTVAAAVLASASAASAAGNPGPKSGGTFALITATAPGSRVVTPSAGVGVGPKAVVTNPNNVPLLQNAGSLRVVR